MNLTSSMNTLTRFTEPVSAFWNARDARERKLLAAAIAVLTIALVYLLLIDPALSGREQLNKNLPALRQQVAELQALSKEAGNLSAKGAQAVVPLSKESLETSLERKGLKPQNLALTGGDTVRVQWAAVPFAGVVNWIDEMQRTALLSVVEANVTALPEAGMVNATLTLRQQKNE